MKGNPGGEKDDVCECLCFIGRRIGRLGCHTLRRQPHRSLDTESGLEWQSEDNWQKTCATVGHVNHLILNISYLGRAEKECSQSPANSFRFMCLHPKDCYLLIALSVYKGEPLQIKKVKTKRDMVSNVMCIWIRKFACGKTTTPLAIPTWTLWNILEQNRVLFQFNANTSAVLREAAPSCTEDNATYLNAEFLLTLYLLMSHHLCPHKYARSVEEPVLTYYFERFVSYLERGCV